METNYENLVTKLRNRRICIQSGGDLEQDFPLMTEAADAIEDLKAKLTRCTNELCLKCGEYKTRHLGSCEGCIFSSEEYS